MHGVDEFSWASRLNVLRFLVLKLARKLLLWSVIVERWLFEYLAPIQG